MDNDLIYSCNNIATREKHCSKIERVLIVEDLISLQSHIAKNLTDELNLECDVASTEGEAITLLKKKSYDLVISDLSLPDSSGNFIGALVRKKNRIFIITASEDEAQRTKLSSLPIVDYLYKTDEKTIINYLIKSIARLRKNEQTVIAICDDSKIVRMKIIEILIRQNFSYVEFIDGQEAHKCILNKGFKVELLITDVSMPNMDGFNLVRHLRLKYNMNELPILALSASDKRSTVSQMLKLGTNDYISKPFSNEEFMTRLNNALDQSRLYHDNQILIKKLEKMTTTDFLTKLYNRNYFYSIISHIQAQAKRDAYTFGVIMLDIDHFKHVNDTFGHEAGDIALKQTADKIQASARESDVPCRWGGEEFLILVPKSNLESLLNYAERLRILIETNPIVIDPGILEFKLTASLGVAIGSEENFETIIAKADEYLYRVKKSGRNAVGYE